MGRIEGDARTVRELLDNAHYTIDFYQREYAWQQRQVAELIDDLTGKFLAEYRPSHARPEVANYGPYFLGSVIISRKRNLKYIVDGQQRLTTLTLLLIYIRRLAQPDAGVRDVRNLIYSEQWGNKRLNIDVEDRREAIQSLLDGTTMPLDGLSESARNLLNRFENIELPEDVTGPALPYFVDWLLEKVFLVEIVADSDDDAYTIFETMNDRGLSLSLPDMLKGYVLANIRVENQQRVVNATWKRHMQALRTHEGEGEEKADVAFFKNWLRARHAETIRSREKGAQNQDYERIGNQFHRWVRDQHSVLGLNHSDDFVRFIERDLAFYARQAQALQDAGRTLQARWPAVRYNEQRGFTLQTQLCLAALVPEDPPPIVEQKIALVADFLDIWLSRRVWNFRAVDYSSVLYAIFALTREVRGRDVPGLSAFLRDKLEQQEERFAHQPQFRMHQQNYHQVRHLLARLTLWLDEECGLATRFEDLVSKGRKRPFEIEHIWANKYERFADRYRHPRDFDEARNRIGGLLLLQSGINQSLSAMSYEDKRNAYVSHGQNLLARSLHPLAYEHNPAFRAFRERTGLAFRPYDHFGPEEQAERQALYIRMAEWIWNPSRLDLDGLKPPAHDAIEELEEQGEEAVGVNRHDARHRFWTALLAVAQARSELHRQISPSRSNWIGTRRGWNAWNYVVTQHETRAELYLDGPDGLPKAVFDALHTQQAAIEGEVGPGLVWQRLSEQRASRISIVFPGGWGDETTWPTAIEAAVNGMQRLYEALNKRLPTG